MCVELWMLEIWGTQPMVYQLHNQYTHWNQQGVYVIIY